MRMAFHKPGKLFRAVCLVEFKLMQSQKNISVHAFKMMLFVDSQTFTFYIIILKQPTYSLDIIGSF